MSLEIFFEKFADLTESPDAVGELRELLVQLAVRGKLVSQDLRESAESQLRLANDFRLRKGGAAAMSTEDVPFPIPENWKWVAIGDTMELINGKAFKSEEWSIDGTPIIRIQNLNNENAPFNRCNLDVDPKVHVSNGDLLISWSGTPGTSFGAFIWNRGFAYLNQHIFRCELVKGVFVKEFLRLAVNARLEEMISHAQGGVGLRHITKGKLESISLPLPPLSEQERIMAKVEELVALCDCLEAQLKEREVRHSALTSAAVNRFNEAPTLANLDLLFHKSYSIPPLGLRECILSVAIRGKLNSQDSNDEPATSLVEAIAEFRSRWLDGKRDKSLKRVREIDNKKCSYDIPASWTWCRLGDVVLEFRYGTSRKCSREQPGVPVLRIPNIQAGRVDASDLKFTSMPSSEFAELRLQRGDLLVVRSNGSERLVGRSAVVSPEDEQFVYAGYLVRLRIPHKLIYPRYLQLALSSAEVRNQIEGPIRTTSGVKNINTTELSNLVFPLAPFAEQRRIVDRIDRLAPLVDKMEAQLAILRGISTEFLDAAVHEILQSSDASTVSSNRRQDSTAHRLSIGCYVINQLTQNPNFGRTMLMKVFYLSEAYVGLPQAWQPLRHAAGPYDPAIEGFESIGIQSGLFTVKTKTLGNGHEMVQYESKSGMNQTIAEAVSLLGGRQVKFDRLLRLFQNKTTEEAEIIATLFAAWNDMLIDGKSPSDDEIIREVRENWHYKKERFTPTLLTRWLNWLRQQSVIPRGLAPRTRQQLKLGLS